MLGMTWASELGTYVSAASLNIYELQPHETYGCFGRGPEGLGSPSFKLIYGELGLIKANKGGALGGSTVGVVWEPMIAASHYLAVWWVWGAQRRYITGFSMV